MSGFHSHTEPGFHILHRADDWLAVCKPAGIGMHTESQPGKNTEPGFIVQLSQQLGIDIWPVHRLDKVTSGILLVATSAEAAARLSGLFAEHQIDKFYLARSSQKPKKKQGWIKGDMEKSRNGSWKLLRSTDNPAITRFISQAVPATEQAQSNMGSDTGSKRLFLLKPHTGRTHQLRVALKSLGAAIDGDQRYKGNAAERTYLHAWAIRFNDRGDLIELVCAPQQVQSSGSSQANNQQENWGAIPEAWRSPWQLF